ncbi:MAG: ABC transporter permease subunit [Spirochaetales bacterium]|nr:ABC transporter permease subunit [Spirochaetales bacterium]
MMKFKLNPLTVKKIKRFISIKRGFYSFIIFIFFILFSFFAELFINNRALIVSYNNKLYFPTYGQMIPGNVFDLSYDYETNYRELKERCEKENKGNWVLLPLVPYNPYENDFRENEYPPAPPSFGSQHFLGTDKAGRDILARLVYGFRVAIIFSLSLLGICYLIGIILGCAMGYLGGLFDLLFQRIIEIWNAVPYLYVIIIISSIVFPNVLILILINVFFGWYGMTWIMRTLTYKEKARDYVLAAKSIGASSIRIILKHIIPNTISIIVTYAPFSVASGIITLTALDYLGYGLRPPTPSWGELLEQGWTNLSDYWIAFSVIAAMVITLTLVTFVGEAVREAFDPKMHTTYE